MQRWSESALCSDRRRGCHSGSLACAKDLAVPWGEWGQTAMLHCRMNVCCVFWLLLQLNSICDLLPQMCGASMNICSPTDTCHQPADPKYLQYFFALSFTFNTAPRSPRGGEGWWNKILSFNYWSFMSTCPAKEWGEKIAKYRYKLQFDQFISNQRTHAHAQTTLLFKPI